MDLLDRIYEAALDPEEWVRVISEISRRGRRLGG